MEVVQVQPRDSYLHYIYVPTKGTAIRWSFNTKRNNISFGLYRRRGQAPLPSSSDIIFRAQQQLQQRQMSAGELLVPENGRKTGKGKEEPTIRQPRTLNQPRHAFLLCQTTMTPTPMPHPLTVQPATAHAPNRSLPPNCVNRVSTRFCPFSTPTRARSRSKAPTSSRSLATTCLSLVRLAFLGLARAARLCCCTCSRLPLLTSRQYVFEKQGQDTDVLGRSGRC